MTYNANVLLKNILSAVQTAPTLTAVADWLYTTQPNIIKTISEAEKKYGVNLVNRNKTPISLTSAGVILLNRLNEILNLEEKTIEEMQNYQDKQERLITIAFFPTYAPIIFPKIYFALNQKYPNLKFRTLSLTTSKALEALKDGHANILIGRNANDPQINSWPLFTEKLCFVIPKTNSLYKNAELERQISDNELKNIQQENHISWSSETSFIDVTQHLFLLNDLHLKSNLTANTYEEALLYTKSGLGITMTMLKTARSFLHDNQDVNLLIIPEKMASLEISIMAMNSDPVAKEIAAEIAKI